MYVSDEDEKPEVSVRPALEVDPLVHEPMSADSDNDGAGKRPRIQFFPPF